jgi:hypothetical protein
MARSAFVRGAVPVLIVVLAVAAGACSAEFRSGVTACGAREPRCPTGFTCVNDVRCVKVGQGTDVGRTDGGSAGGPDAPVATPTADAGLGPATMMDAARPLDVAPAADAAPVSSDAGVIAVDAAGTDAPPVPTGAAVVKFCNGLRRADGTPAEMELVLGTMRFKAASRECAPAAGLACAPVPAGSVTAQLFFGGMMIATSQLTLDQSGQYLLSPGYDATAKAYTIGSNKLAVGQACANYSYPPVAAVKFCNQLMMVGAMGEPIPVTLDLVIGADKITAATGQCNTLEGRACDLFRTGMVRASLQREGKELGAAMLNLEANRDYALLGQFDPTTMGPRLTAVSLPAGQSCAAYKPPAPPPPAVTDAGTGG